MSTIDITCSLPAPTLAQVRAWLTRNSWTVSNPWLDQAPHSERWSHSEHGSAWLPREEQYAWLLCASNWIANRAWQIESTSEAVYRDIMGPAKAAGARVAELEKAARWALDDLREHVADGECAGPHGNAREGACSRCRPAKYLADALEVRT